MAKLLEQSTTRLSLAILMTDATQPNAPITQGVSLKVRGVSARPLMHRKGYWLFMDLPPGPQVLSWQSEQYQDGEQAVNPAALPRLAPIVQVSLTARP